MMYDSAKPAEITATFEFLITPNWSCVLTYIFGVLGNPLACSCPLENDDVTATRGLLITTYPLYTMGDPLKQKMFCVSVAHIARAGVLTESWPSFDLQDLRTMPQCRLR